MKLLVPSNFSKIANAALKTASEICSKVSESNISLVYFVESSTDQVVPFLEYDKLPMVQQSFNEAISKYPSTNIKGYYILHSSTASLYKLVDSLAADLLVMGTNEVERYEDEKLVGKHTKSCIQNLQTPILCLRKELMDLNFKKIVFTTNFKSQQIEDFNRLFPVLRVLDVQVEILLVSTPQKFITTEKAERLFEESSKLIEYKNLKFRHYNDIGIVEGIVAYCKKRGVDLLILPTQGRKGFDRFFNGSIAELVLDETRIPTISILE